MDSDLYNFNTAKGQLIALVSQIRYRKDIFPLKP